MNDDEVKNDSVEAVETETPEVEVNHVNDMINQLVEENLIISENNGSEELDNIHEIMYNLSTRWKTSGGSEKVWQ